MVPRAVPPASRCCGDPGRGRPAAPENRHRLPDTVVRAVQGDDGGDLDGLEDPVVQVAFDAGQGVDQTLVAHHEAHAPAGHVVALGQREGSTPTFLAPGAWRKLGAT